MKAETQASGKGHYGMLVIAFKHTVPHCCVAGPLLVLSAVRHACMVHIV